jgi:electron transport complex protein RnfE
MGGISRFTNHIYYYKICAQFNNLTGKILKILSENPVFKLLLGLCPTLAVTTSVMNGIGMGGAATVVLVFSNLIISLLKNVIPSKIRIPLFIVVVVTFVTIIDMLMAGFLPELHKSLGIFIPLIVVNCIILGRAEAFAYKHDWLSAMKDGLYNGIGFMLALIMLASLRELLGNGTLLGHAVMPQNYVPVLLFILPPGAFLLLGVLIALVNLKASKN